MNILRKTNPHTDLTWSTFGDGVDNLFEGFFRPMNYPASPWQDKSPAVDITENESEFRVRADIPGVEKDNVDVRLEDDLLTITAVIDKKHEDKEEGRVIRQERNYGKFVRSMQLGRQVDTGKVKATYNNGVLELLLPKKEDAKAKSVSIEVK